MKKAFLVVIIICVATIGIHTGCTDKKTEKADSVAIDSVVIDTIDSIDSATAIIAETPMPKAADQLFDDFFFNFIANKKLQKNRIKFPLPVYEGEKTTYIQRESWKMEQFFRQQGYFTLIFDDEEQMKLSKSTELDSVIVEKIYLNKGLVEQYWFDHQNGSWTMNQIKKVGFSKSINASFLQFLPKLLKGNDLSLVKSPLPYHGPDPNGDDHNFVNMTLPAEEWSSFLPEVPQNVIYNILYGQKYSESNNKILTFRGLSNGVETQLVFKKQGNNWRLIKINAS